MNGPANPQFQDQVDIVRDRIERHVRMQFAITYDEATTEQIFQAVSYVAREQIMETWIHSRQKTQREGMKCLIYLSAEYLIGRALTNNLINTGVYQVYAQALRDMGVDVDAVENCEDDAGLGNGGLGRLAACFLDSLATLGLPTMASGIRYQHGFFKQQIQDGQQIEVADTWAQDGDAWEVERGDRTFEVRFGGTVDEEWDNSGHLSVHYHDYNSVYAKPYDMPIVGYSSPYVATLRLWSAQSPRQLDLLRFNKGDYLDAMAERELAESISMVLYPEDSHPKGQELRLRQFYFLASATMQSVVYTHKLRNHDLHTLPDKIVIQINDTHPALAIPELIRLLIDENGFGWEEALDITHDLFNYTNHTIMPEALEKWPAGIMQRLLPRIYRIIETIDARIRDRIWQMYPGDTQRVERMPIISGGMVRMANLCVLTCGHVNGVSQLHGELLKQTVFSDFYQIFPERFSGITNGITQRRWLAVSNPRLASLIDETIGQGFMKDWRKIEQLAPYADDVQFRQAFAQVKRQNKHDFAQWMLKTRGVSIDPDSIIDVQAKRLHEYKRQLLKVLHILSLYDGIVEGRITNMPKTTFVFAAKAAPGYHRAKEIIRLINATASLIASDERTRDVIPVVFLANYDVTAAQHLIPAADISEQISTAGREASGTGNMKFMLNGALTLGTMDGANIEMCQRAGQQNMFIFGARVEELQQLERDHSYDSRRCASENPVIAGALRHLIDGTLPTSDGSRFENIYYSLVPDGGHGDPYYVLKDFSSYDQAFEQAIWLYQNDPEEWTRRCVLNVAAAGFFSSDRTIDEYNRQIWHLQALEDGE